MTTTRSTQTGDRVRFTGRGRNHGQVGTVVEVDNSTVVVEFDGHTFTDGTNERDRVQQRMVERV